MTMSTYLPACQASRHLEPGKRLGSSLSSSRLDAAWPFAHGLLSEESKELLGRSEDLAGAPGPCSPHLYRMFEAELARMNTHSMRRLCHQQPDHVVGQQGHPQLFHHHLRGKAPQNLQPQCGFKVANVQLHLPTPRVQPRQLALADRTRIQQRGHQ